MKRGKLYRKALEDSDVKKEYSVEEILNTIKEASFVKFDESVDISVKLNLKKGSVLRDSLIFPHTFKGEKKILVFAKGDKAKEAQEAGATYVGDDDYIAKIREGWLDFDVVIATPDMMKDVGRLGAILGKRGLMPNPRTKTVTNDILSTVGQFKKGRMEYKTDKAGVLNLSVGKLSMAKETLLENLNFFLKELLQKKPQDTKGQFIRSIFLSSTMGLGFKLALKELAN